ncbi:MAG: hypothetical protein GX154_00120 [Clostridiales bacterium]|nr:hypothetical protein [Clostridiales bacterium]
MTNLFGEEYENTCTEGCAETPKKGKVKGTPAKKTGDETPLEMREVRVKIYNDFFTYIAPEEVENPTFGDVRKYLVAQGYSELSADRTQFMWVEEGDEKFLVTGIKFEKMG